MWQLRCLYCIAIICIIGCSDAWILMSAAKPTVWTVFGDLAQRTHSINLGNRPKLLMAYALL